MRTVLIVDDSISIRHTIKSILENNGIYVKEAIGEAGMLKNMEEFGMPVDVVIMDLSLKSENGFDLIKKLQKNKKYGNIPVIVLTSFTSKDNVLEARNLGVKGYIKKPFTAEILMRTINEIIPPEIK